MGTVNRFRISWVSSRALPSRIVGGAGDPDLSRQWSYSQAFEAAHGASAWRRPWVGDVSYSHLWESNLGGGYRASTNWDKAWKRVVPLRAGDKPPLSTTVPDVTISCEQYLFPSGVAGMVVADIQGELSNARLLEIAEELGKRSSLSFDGQPAKKMSAVLGAVLDDAETKVFGAADPEALGTRRPETVATVVSTTDAATDAIEQGGETHKLLSGLCQLTSQISSQNVGELSQDLLAAANHHRETVRLNIGPGRAVWSPMQSNDREGVGKLSCFHSNVSFSTLQVDLMLNSARWAASVGWQAIPPPAIDLLRPQLNLFGLLYGKTEVYTTRFVRRQIDESGLVGPISELRFRLGVGQALS
jgi:hypothetical protein